jgi:hypothetical protein
LSLSSLILSFSCRSLSIQYTKTTFHK